MIIEGEISDGVTTHVVTSTWTHNPDDPWVAKVDFQIGAMGNVVTWVFSLDLFMEAFTSPSDGLQGSGDVLVEVGENFSFLHLSNGRDSGSVQFSTADIREFLNQVDDHGSEEIIARELEEFLSQY